MTSRVFISADHGLSVIYFLQSDVISTLLKEGVEVVLFTDDEARPAIEERFHQPGIIFEGLRLKECERYFQTVDPFIQRSLQMLRWVGGSNRINVTAMDGNYHLLAGGFTGGGRFALPFLRTLIWLMRRSYLLRRLVVRAQEDLEMRRELEPLGPHEPRNDPVPAGLWFVPSSITIRRSTKTYLININRTWWLPAPPAGGWIVTC